MTELTPEQKARIAKAIQGAPKVNLGLSEGDEDESGGGGGLLLMPVLLPVRLWGLVLVVFKRVLQISPSCSELTRTLKDASINRVIPAKAGI
jgi:hypothetical protein